MHLHVQSISSPLESASVVVQSAVSGTKTRALTLGGGHEAFLTPFCPELASQLILIEQWGEPPYEYCGSGMPESGRVYVMAPLLPEPKLKALWLGRLKPNWAGEPIIAKIWPVFSGGECEPRYNVLLSGLLHGLFAASYMHGPITVHLGTNASLTALQQIVQKAASYSRPDPRRMFRAVLELQVLQKDLQQCAPFILGIVNQVMRDISARDAELQTELDGAEKVLATAQKEFDRAKQSINAKRRGLWELERTYVAWLAQNQYLEAQGVPDT